MSNNGINSSNLFKYTNFPQNKKTKAQEQMPENKDNKININQETNIASEDVLNYLSLSANYNNFNIKQKTSAINIDPTKYLSPERIADIEKSISKFEDLYNDAYAAINNEVGDSISESAKQALAEMYIN